MGWFTLACSEAGGVLCSEVDKATTAAANMDPRIMVFMAVSEVWRTA
jgi:hypothetical protein